MSALTTALRQLILLALSVCIAAPLVAVINSTNTSNTSAPTGVGDQPSDPGFSNVVQVSGSTGVYLGHGWFITANHVGAGNVTIGSTTYNVASGTAQRIGVTDLQVFRVVPNPTYPNLPPIAIAGTRPEVNDFTVMIGGGRQRETDTTTWYVDTNTDPWTWSETPPGATGTGYKWLDSSTRAVRWGTNTIAGYQEDVSYTFAGTPYTQDVIFTTFDASGTAYEAQAVRNDSGGGMFVETTNGWELAGIMVTVMSYSGQPEFTSVFGNQTVAVDLSVYRDEILAIIPEPSTFVWTAALAATVVIMCRRRRMKGWWN